MVKAPTTLAGFLGYKLRLPHTYWGKDAAKFYPEDHKTGYSVVVLKTYVPATDDDHECLEFMADDGEMYKIVHQSLRTYWTQKRFEGEVLIVYCLFVVCVAFPLFADCFLCAAIPHSATRCFTCIEAAA